MSGLIVAAICGSMFFFGLMIARKKQQLIIVVAILTVFLAIWASLWTGRFVKETYPGLFNATYLALVGLGINSWRFASAGGLEKPFTYIRSALRISACYFVIACTLAVGLDWPAAYIILPFFIAFAVYKEVGIRRARRARQEEEENAGL